MKNHQQTPYTIAKETLTYAMIASLLITAVVTAGIYTVSPFTIFTTGVIMFGSSAVLTVVVTPHLIAYWTGIPVDVLLGITQPNRTYNIKTQ